MTTSRAWSARLLSLAVLAVVMTGFSGCIIPIPAPATATRTADLASGGEPIVVVLYSKDFAPETPAGLGREMVTCITRRVAKTAPDVRLVSEAEFFREVFEAEASAVLLRPETLQGLLAQPHVAARLTSTGLTHLVLVGGATIRIGGSSTGGAGFRVAVVALEARKSTRLWASIVDVRQGAQVTRVEATAERDQAIVGGVVCCVPFLFGWIPMTESSSCDALGAEVARTLAERRPHHADP